MRSSDEVPRKGKGAKASNELESNISQLKIFRKMELFETTLLRGKTQTVSIEQVKSAYAKVKANGGAGGVDKISVTIQVLKS